MGDNLGKVLMQSFAHFLHQYEEDVRVEMIGAPLENPIDFSEADRCYSTPQDQSGPHGTALRYRTTQHIVESIATAKLSIVTDDQLAVHIAG